MTTKTVSPKHPLIQSNGFSLAEMLISLAIFSIVIVPFISLPIKAMEKEEEIESTGAILQEIETVFNAEFRKSLASTKHFYPLDAPINVNLNHKKLLFVAYYDSKRSKVYRYGYALKQVTHDNETVEYQLLRSEIDDDNQLLTDYALNQNVWHGLGQSDEEDGIHIAAPTGYNVEFEYCIGRTCNSSIKPKEANGVQIVSKTGTSSTSISALSSAVSDQYGPLEIKHKTSRVSVGKLYYKLGSNISERNNNYGPLAFPGLIQEDLLRNINLRENAAIYPSPYKLSNSGTVGRAIILGDPHYNNKEDSLLLVGQSPSRSTQKSFYIIKWKPDSKLYNGYNASGGSAATSSDHFPVTINFRTAGFPTTDDGRTDSPFTFRSVTQDNKDFIYVLATSGSDARILTFSPEGVFVSESQISGISIAPTGAVVPEISDAIALTFNPNTPKELHVLVRIGEDDYYIRTYSLENISRDNLLNTHTAQSVKLNTSRISGAYFNTVTPNGLEITPEKHYVISGTGSNGSCEYLAIPSNIHEQSKDGQNMDNNYGSPSSRGYKITRVNTPAGGSLSNCKGVAWLNDKKLLFSLSTTDQLLYIGNTKANERNFY